MRPTRWRRSTHVVIGVAILVLVAAVVAAAAVLTRNKPAATANGPGSKPQPALVTANPGVKPLPDNAAYREIHPLLLPEVWPPDAANAAATAQYITERGMKAFQAAISKGQHEFPDGLFFGGQAPTWSNLTLRKVLQKYGQRCQKMAWIDLHTGLGPSGLGERIFACADDAAAYTRAKAWWGQGVTSIYDGSSTSPMLTGLMWMSAYQECPQAEYTGIAMEYGTQTQDKVMYALRGDHWLHLHPEAPEALRQQIKRNLMDAFYVDTNEWRTQIVDQAMESMHQAVTGLNS